MTTEIEKIMDIAYWEVGDILVEDTDWDERRYRRLNTGIELLMASVSLARALAELGKKEEES